MRNQRGPSQLGNLWVRYTVQQGATFYFSFCPPSALPSDHKKTLPDFAAVQPPTSNLRPILYSGANQICIGWPQVERRRLDRGKVRKSFLWSVGLSVGGGSDGKGRSRRADGRRQMDGSFYFALEPPFNK